MAVSKKLTKESFRSWLGEQSPKTKVGFRDGKTPVERFLEKQKVEGTELPVWADKHNQAVRSHDAASISANAAQRLLDGIR